MSNVATTLPPGAGYGVVVGVGFFFAVVMMFISYLQNRYTQFSTHQSEEFNTASRSVKPGLIAAGIVSAWTWAATLLQSSSVGYQFGVSGPFWYAAGATVQILTFSVLACKGACSLETLFFSLLLFCWTELMLSSQAKRTALPHVFGDYLHPLWDSGARHLHHVCAHHKHPGGQPIAAGRQRRHGQLDRRQRVRGHLPHPHRCLRLRCPGRSASDLSL